jgi:hypothetical protein
VPHSPSSSDVSSVYNLFNNKLFPPEKGDCTIRGFGAKARFVTFADQMLDLSGSV